MISEAAEKIERALAAGRPGLQVEALALVREVVPNTAIKSENELTALCELAHCTIGEDLVGDSLASCRGLRQVVRHSVSDRMAIVLGDRRWADLEF